MIAMYDGECGRCFGTVFADDTEIQFHSQYGWVHQNDVDCDDDLDEEFFACAD